MRNLLSFMVRTTALLSAMGAIGVACGSTDSSSDQQAPWMVEQARAARPPPVPAVRHRRGLRAALPKLVAPRARAPVAVDLPPAAALLARPVALPARVERAGPEAMAARRRCHLSTLLANVAGKPARSMSGANILAAEPCRCAWRCPAWTGARARWATNRASRSRAAVGVASTRARFHRAPSNGRRSPGAPSWADRSTACVREGQTR
jgi:hypothetical protein